MWLFRCVSEGGCVSVLAQGPGPRVQGVGLGLRVQGVGLFRCVSEGWPLVCQYWLWIKGGHKEGIKGAVACAEDKH